MFINNVRLDRTQTSADYDGLLNWMMHVYIHVVTIAGSADHGGGFKPEVNIMDKGRGPI